MIASLSGIRGVLNSDITLADVARFAEHFADASGGSEVLLARDTRSTGPAFCSAVAAGLTARGKTVFDCGVASTPAVFRQSRVTGLPAVIVTASHNEPEYNGLKFVVEGAGIGTELFDQVMRPGQKPEKFGKGAMKRGPGMRYVADLVERFGEGSCEGVRVALDLGGGAAIAHAPSILRRLGCEIETVNDTAGVFSRRVDPVADDLALLRRLVKEEAFDIGLAFDCDGDRLVIVDPEGRKRSGDFMLTLALSEIVRERKEKHVVVSVDTTQAVEDVVRRAGGEVFRAKVGEANVVGKMDEVGAEVGGEGSSGGLIDGSFNFCRDSMLAALVIARALKRDGKGFYRSVPAFHQARVALGIPRKKAERGMARIARESGDADRTDGVKVRVSRRSWVLIRPSGTEDKVRVSAEATSAREAGQLAEKYAKKLKELSR